MRVGYVTKQANRHYKRALRTVSIKADIYILPNTHKVAYSQLGSRLVGEAKEIGVGRMHKSDASNNEYVSLSIAAPAFGPEKLYGNFGMAADSDDRDLYAAIWNPADQTTAPAQDLHGGNHL